MSFSSPCPSVEDMRGIPEESLSVSPLRCQSSDLWGVKWAQLSFDVFREKGSERKVDQISAFVFLFKCQYNSSGACNSIVD